MKGINSWSGAFTSKIPALNNRHRLSQLRKFMGRETLENVHSLDIGPKNYISEQMKVEHQTRGDLNYKVSAPDKDYQTILFLEVLNHLQNQLFTLEEIHKLLAPNGRLILSTPRPGIINLSHGKGNYVEIKERNVLKLLEYSGFRVIRKEIFRSYPFIFVFYGWLQPIRWLFPFKGDTIHASGAPRARWWYLGFRPPIKWLLHKYLIVEAEKI